jgi:hypothetical protein
MTRSIHPLKNLPTERYRTARWALFGIPGFLSSARQLGGLHALSKARLIRLPVAWTDADAEPRSTNADARPAMVIAVVVVSPRRVIAVPDDHATITPGIPALAGVVTNQPCLVEQRRAVSDLNLVGGISARGYEGTGAGEECQCQFSHVHLLSEEAPRANVSTKAPVPRKFALVIDMEPNF